MARITGEDDAELDLPGRPRSAFLRLARPGSEAVISYARDEWRSAPILRMGACEALVLEEPCSPGRRAQLTVSGGRVIGGEDKGSAGDAVAYGHVFESFCFVVRPGSNCQSRESLGYALHRGLCRVLQIDLKEVGVSFRRAVGGGDEIILHDKAPGGAGLVKEAHLRWSEIVSETRHVVTDCDCERACYDCLKDFANQTHHQALNRHDVITFFNG